MNKPDWTDMSDFVVHFAKQYEGKNGYENMLGILGQSVICARNPFGIAHKIAPDTDGQRAVCFSEIPLHLLERLSQKRSEYGIVFRKDFVLAHGGNPILYAYRDGPVRKALEKVMNVAKDDPDDPVWQVIPFVDAPGTYKSPYFFEWEREWRVLGDFKFTTDDVAFLIIPEHLHILAKKFFINAREDNVGPCYECPFIDAHWKFDKIKPLISALIGSAWGRKGE